MLWVKSLVNSSFLCVATFVTRSKLWHPFISPSTVAMDAATKNLLVGQAARESLSVKENGKVGMTCRDIKVYQLEERQRLHPANAEALRLAEARHRFWHRHFAPRARSRSRWDAGAEMGLEFCDAQCSDDLKSINNESPFLHVCLSLRAATTALNDTSIKLEATQLPPHCTPMFVEHFLSVQKKPSVSNLMQLFCDLGFRLMFSVPQSPHCILTFTQKNVIQFYTQSVLHWFSKAQFNIKHTYLFDFESIRAVKSSKQKHSVWFFATNKINQK